MEKKIISEVVRVLQEEGIWHFLRRKLLPQTILFEGKKIKTINFRKHKIRILLDSENGFVDRHIFFCGTWERDILLKITKMLNKDMTVLDIGANIGQHSLIFSRYCKKVIAFEPIPKIYNQFKESIEINGYKNIVIHNFAVGDKKEDAKINVLKENAGGSSLKHVEKPGQSKINIKINLLENMVCEKVDFVKIDTEGYEPNVVLGNKTFFIKNRPTFAMEFTPNYYDKEGEFSTHNLYQFFIDNDYKIFSLNKDRYINNLDESLSEFQDEWIVYPQ